jgi:hypothetical protein
MEDDPIMKAVRAFVRAHEIKGGRNDEREAIIYFTGHGELLHHAFDEDNPAPDVDDAFINELVYADLLDREFNNGTWSLAPTPAARNLVETADRVTDTKPRADLADLVAAVGAQAEAENKLGWVAVRPVLVALRRYWESGGFSQYGIQLPAILKALPAEHRALFGATVRSFLEGEYLRALPTILETEGLPVEVTFTDRARSMVDGWPGASDQDRYENVLAVVESLREQATDEREKGKLATFRDAVRDVGVQTMSEVIAKGITG